jgi:hypothetical protein
MPKYSIVQYLLWLASGSEISALENCPNEFNRHANIGMMICITAIFAGVTSFIAGSTFVGGNWGGVFLFCILWAILIFSLDRSMVNSIKKDPTEAKPRIAGYLIPRLVLAVILSFFMSIPLDHIIFGERIERQMELNNRADWLKKRADLAKGYDISGMEAREKGYTQDYDNLDNELKSGCPLPDYKQKVQEFQDSARRKNQLQKLADQARTARNRYYNNWQGTDDSLQRDRQYRDLKVDLRHKEGELASIVRNTAAIKAAADTISAHWEDETNDNKRRAYSNKQRATKILQANSDSVQNQTNAYKTTLNGMRGFDTQFETLFLMPNWGVQVLKWLIFLGLTVIEILPTYLKLRTPVGQYDWAIYGRDQETIMGAKARITRFEEEAGAVEDYRKEKETEMNKRLIDRIATIEEKLANGQLDDWEEQVGTAKP